MVLGLVGTLLPVLPGLLLMWAAAVVWGMVAGMDAFGWAALITITVVMLLAGWLALRLPVSRTAESGVGVGSQLLAIGLASIGFFVIPIAGAAIGFVGGIFLTRYLSTRDISSAWTSTKAALVAMWHAAAVQFGGGVAILLIWVIWLLVG
jgi:uncharacterized protein YqgC (DUF456 family)